MAPAEISAQHNPLRSPKDYRLNRIAGPSSLIIFGVTGDLSRKKLMPAVYDQREAGRQQPPVREVVDRGHELLAGEVAGHAEDDEARRAGDPVEAVVLGRAQRVPLR